MTDKSIIDMELGASLVGGDEGMAKELLDLLVESLPTHQAKITEFFEGNQFADLRNETHKLHGATCYTGTPKLKACAKALEQAAKHQETDKLPALYQGLMKAITEVQEHAS